MEQIFFKKIINAKNKYIIFSLITGVFMALYFGSGAINAQFTQLLPMSEWDSMIPFLPWTVWVYVFAYPTFLLWCLYSVKCEMKMNKTLYGIIILTIMSNITYIWYPVGTYRWQFPVLQGANLTNNIIYLLRRVDPSNNNLPGIQAGICYLAATTFKGIQKRNYIFAIIISLLIIFSSLAIKQQYFYSIATGLLLAASIDLFISKVISFDTNSKH